MVGDIAIVDQEYAGLKRWYYCMTLLVEMALARDVGLQVNKPRASVYISNTTC